MLLEDISACQQNVKRQQNECFCLLEAVFCFLYCNLLDASVFICWTYFRNFLQPHTVPNLSTVDVRTYCIVSIFVYYARFV
jgi:hypothetical protein